MRWIVDDRGRAAVLTSHPLAVWASDFDPPIKAILDLGFICIEDRSKDLILALNTSLVKRVTLVGAFYFLAQHNESRVIICSNCWSESAHFIILNNVNASYRLLEEMTTSSLADIPSIVRRWQNENIRFGHLRSRRIHQSRSQLADAE